MAEEVELNKTEYLNAIGARIKELREERGIKAAELARLTYSERSHIARLETGGTNPTATTLLTICKALNVSLEEFFSGVDSSQFL